MLITFNGIFYINYFATCAIDISLQSPSDIPSFIQCDSTLLGECDGLSFGEWNDILSHPQVKVLGTSLSWLLGLSPCWDLAEWFSLNMLLGKSTSISLVMLIDWSLGISLGWLLGLLPCWGV